MSEHVTDQPDEGFRKATSSAGERLDLLINPRLNIGAIHARVSVLTATIRGTAGKNTGHSILIAYLA